MKANKMVHQLTKDILDGNIYVIPTIRIFKSKPLSIILICFKFLNFGYTYHYRKKRFKVYF